MGIWMMRLAPWMILLLGAAPPQEGPDVGPNRADEPVSKEFSP